VVNGEAQEFYTPYTERLSREQVADIVSLPVVRAALNQSSITVDTASELVTTGRWNVYRDQPYGLVVVVQDASVESGYVSTWSDQVIVLTREKIEALLTGGISSATVEVHEKGSMTGQATKTMGECTLYLRIERLPDTPPPATASDDPSTGAPPPATASADPSTGTAPPGTASAGQPTDTPPPGSDQPGGSSSGQSPGAGEPTPDAFSFSDTHLAAPGVDYESNSVRISGITTGVPISVSNNGYYSVNGGGYRSEPGIVNNGDTVSLQGRLNLLDVKRYITLTVGGQSATWLLSTLP
jgi:hypothetical protein